MIKYIMRTGNILMCIVVVAFIFYMLTNSKQIGLEGACGCAPGKCTCGKEAFYEGVDGDDSSSDDEANSGSDPDSAEGSGNESSDDGSIEESEPEGFSDDSDFA